jgi:hypothetical protein
MKTNKTNIRDYILESTEIDMFDRSTMGASGYDEIMKNPEYFKKEKGIDYKIIDMTPDEYLKTVKDYQFKGFVKSNPDKDIKTLKDYWYKNHDWRDEDNIQKYIKAVHQGSKFPLPYLVHHNDGGFSQEGRHRAEVAKRVGLTHIPVVVIDEDPYGLYS